MPGDTCEMVPIRRWPMRLPLYLPGSRVVILGSNVSKLGAELRGATDEFSFDLWAKKWSIGRLQNLATYIRRTDKR